MADDIRNQGVDPFLRLEGGTIPGFKRYKKFGRNPSCTINVWETIWDGSNDYPYSDVNLVSPTIVSDDATDDHIIRIEAVDEEFNYVTEDVQLDGLTPVALTKDYMQIFRMENMSSTDLSGEVTVQVGATVYALIQNGTERYNQTQMAIMVVPAGYYGLVTKVGASLVANNSGQINYRSKSFGEAWKVKRPFDISDQVYVEKVDFFFDEKTILDVRVKPTSNSIPVSAWFDIVLVEIPVFEALWDKPNRVTLR